MDPKLQRQAAAFLAPQVEQVATEQLQIMKQQALGKEIIDRCTEIFAGLYDRAATYSTVVIGGGYALFLGLLAVTYPSINHWMALSSALFVLVSAAAFVFFQAHYMWVMANDIVERQRNLSERTKGKPPEAVLEEIQAYERESTNRLLRLVKPWRYCLRCSIVTGALGALILAAAFVYALWTGALASPPQQSTNPPAASAPANPAPGK